MKRLTLLIFYTVIIFFCISCKKTVDVSQPAIPEGTVTSFAGHGWYGYGNGTGIDAYFDYPYGIAIDAIGNLYVGDESNNCIRKITTNGVVTTFAGIPFNGTDNSGSSDGVGTAASFRSPRGVAIDAFGNLYVADYGNNLIRKITSAGIVTTLAGTGIPGSINGAATDASFNRPKEVAVDNASGNVYVADSGNNLIRKINSAGIVTTLAGSGNYGFANGTGITASFADPAGIAVDVLGDIYVADSGNNLIRKISPGGLVITLAGTGSIGAGDGKDTTASFYFPRGIALDASGNIYITDSGYSLIRKITNKGVVTTLAGTGSTGYTDGIGTAAAFNNPKGIAVGHAGNLFIADYGNCKIRKIQN